eukprot:4134991-Amphidinium_carterae.2
MTATIASRSRSLVGCTIAAYRRTTLLQTSWQFQLSQMFMPVSVCARIYIHNVELFHYEGQLGDGEDIPDNTGKSRVETLIQKAA